MAQALLRPLGSLACSAVRSVGIEKDPGSRLLACLPGASSKISFLLPLLIPNCYFGLRCLLQSSSDHQFCSALIARKSHFEYPPRGSRLHPRPLAMAPAASCKFELSTFLVSAGSFRPATDSIRPSVHRPRGRLTPSPQIPPMPCRPRRPHALSQTPSACAISWCPTKPRWVVELTMLIP